VHNKSVFLIRKIFGVIYFTYNQNFMSFTVYERCYALQKCFYTKKHQIYSVKNLKWKLTKLVIILNDIDSEKIIKMYYYNLFDK